MLGYQGRRSSVRDVGVGLLAQASDTYCAHDFAVYAYRNAAAQRHDIGGEIRGKVDISFEDMGSQSLKNIAEPMRVWRARIEPARIKRTAQLHARDEFSQSLDPKRTLVGCATLAQKLAE